MKQLTKLFTLLVLLVLSLGQANCLCDSTDSCKTTSSSGESLQGLPRQEQCVQDLELSCNHDCCCFDCFQSMDLTVSSSDPVLSEIEVYKLTAIPCFFQLELKQRICVEPSWIRGPPSFGLPGKTTHLAKCVFLI